MSADSKPRRHRLLKFLIVLAVLVGVLVLAGPALLSPLVRGRVESTLDDRLNGRSRLAEFSFTLGGDVRAAGLTVEDAAGLPVLSVGRVDVDAGLLPLLRKRVVADVVVEGVEVHLRRTEDGRWNVETLPRERAPAEEEPAGKRPEIPDLDVSFALRDARVVIHGEGGATELRDLALEFDAPGGGAPATLRFAMALAGPQGAAGAMRMDGTVGVTDATLGQGEVDLRIEGLLLRALEPVVAAVAPQLSGLTGRIDGQMDIAMPGDLQIQGEGEIRVTEFTVPAAVAGAAPLAPGPIVLAVDMDMQGAESGRQDLRLSVGDLLAVHYAGTMQSAPGGARDLAGKVTLDGSVARLVHAAGSFVQLTPGLTVDGDLNGGVDFAARIGPDGPGDVTASVDLRVADLAARDAAGQPLDLQGIDQVVIALQSEMRADRFAMPRLEVDAGPVQVHGTAQVTGLGGDATPQVQDSRFEVDADLERLARVLDAFLEGAPPDLGGRLHLLATARQEGEVIHAGLGIEPEGVRFQEFGLAGQPIEGTFEVLLQGERMAVRGGMGTPRIEVTLAEGQRLVQQDLRLEVDVVRPDAASMQIERAQVRSNTFEVAVQGAMSGMEVPAQARGKFQVEVNTALERLLADLGPALGLEGYAGSGAIRLGVDLEQAPEATVARTSLDLGTLQVALPPDAGADGAATQGLALAAQPVKGAFDARLEGERMSVTGNLGTPRVEVTLADGRRVVQQDLRLEVDVTRPDASSVQIQRAQVRSGTFDLAANGRVSGIEDPAHALADVRVDLNAAVERVLADLGPVLGLLGYSGTGDVRAKFDLAQKGEGLTVKGDVALDDLDLTITSQQPGGRTTRLSEPSVTLGLESELAKATETLQLKRFELKSQTAWGSMTGTVSGVAMPGAAPPAGDPPEPFVESMKGTFHYVPDRVGALLNERVPGRLSGAEPEAVTLDFRGPVQDLDLYALLSSATLEVDLGLGTFTAAGIDTTGKLSVKVDDGRLSLLGDLGANGGSLDLQMGVGASSSAPAQARQGAELSLKLDAIRLQGGLGGLLGRVHPVFAPLDQAGAADTLKGVLNAELTLRYNGPTSLEELVRDWRTLPRNLLYGKGMVQLTDAQVQGSPLFRELLGHLDLPATNEPMQIEPIAFEIDSSRLTYADAWRWVIGGIPTSFTGGIGLDGTLDMAWNLPITNKLVKQYDFLESLKGQTIRVPLRGTARSPQLDFHGAVQALAGDVARDNLKEAAEDAGLGGILGGSDPKPILERADALWDAGDKAGAAPYYKRLRDKFRLTPVYLLARDRIDKRAEWEPKKDEVKEPAPGKGAGKEPAEKEPVKDGGPPRNPFDPKAPSRDTGDRPTGSEPADPKRDGKPAGDGKKAEKRDPLLDILDDLILPPWAPPGAPPAADDPAQQPGAKPKAPKKDKTGKDGVQDPRDRKQDAKDSKPDPKDPKSGGKKDKKDGKGDPGSPP